MVYLLYLTPATKIGVIKIKQVKQLIWKCQPVPKSDTSLTHHMIIFSVSRNFIIFVTFRLLNLGHGPEISGR